MLSANLAFYGLASDPRVWPHVTNNPGTRWAPSYWTTTAAQNGQEQTFWMFGGEGFDATGSSGFGFRLLNDLWRYLRIRDSFRDSSLLNQQRPEALTGSPAFFLFPAPFPARSPAPRSQSDFTFPRSSLLKL